MITNTYKIFFGLDAQKMKAVRQLTQQNISLTH